MRAGTALGRSIAVFLAVGCIAPAFAQTVIKVAPPVWAALTQDEKELIQHRYLVEVPEPESYGVILDNQGVNESTPGTTGGAELGSAVASATYIDRAINSQSYSARSHLGVAILGGLVGSALDKPPVQQFHYRYAVRFVNGNVKYFDVVSSNPFRHPAGLCVDLPAVSLAADQGLCTQTAETVRAAYLGSAAARGTLPPTPAPAASPAPPRPSGTPQNTAPAAEPAHTDFVTCKLGALAPVRTTAPKCALINGRVVDE